MDRVSNLQGEVNKFTYNQLKSADIGYKYALTFRGERIPLLTEFIEKCKKLSINIFLELKNYYNNELKLVNNVLEIIKDCNDIKIIPCSYSRKIIKYINELYPNIEKSIIVDEIPSDWYDFVKINNCYSINVAYDRFTSNNLIDIKECVDKIPTYCFTVNNYENYTDLKEIGVKGIITDNAEYFAKY